MQDEIVESVEVTLTHADGRPVLDPATAVVALLELTGHALRVERAADGATWIVDLPAAAFRALTEAGHLVVKTAAWTLEAEWPA